MNNSNTTDTSKTTSQPAPFVKKVEGNETQPAKVEAPKPGTSDTDRQAAGDAKQAATDDTAGKSSR